MIMRNNTKTNLAAIAIIIVFLVGLILVFIGKATLTEVSTFGSGIVAIMTAYGLINAADKQKDTNPFKKH